MQKINADKSASVFTDLVANIEKSNPARFYDTNLAFNIGDLGTATGKNSVAPLQQIIQSVRKFVKDKPISISLEDVNAEGLDEATDNVTKGLQEFENVKIQTIGHTFYGPLFPENSMDFIFSLTALHWMPYAPSILDQFSFRMFESQELTPDEEKWRNLRIESFKTFMTSREKELAPGGQLYVTLTGSADETEEAIQG